MKSRFITALAATAVIATSACALAYTAPGTSLEQTTSGNYEIDGSHTNVLFSLSHMGYSHYYGRFNTISGNLQFDAKTPQNSTLKVTIDIASIDTNNAKLEGELKSKDWFDAAKFPTATFTSTKVEKITPTTGKVTGDLTLHGVTKPVTLDVRLNGAGMNSLANVEELGFSAHGKIKRSDFGVSNYVPMVGDDIELTIESELHLKK